MAETTKFHSTEKEIPCNIYSATQAVSSAWAPRGAGAMLVLGSGLHNSQSCSIPCGSLVPCHTWSCSLEMGCACGNVPKMFNTCRQAAHGGIPRLWDWIFLVLPSQNQTELGRGVPTAAPPPQHPLRHLRGILGFLECDEWKCPPGAWECCRSWGWSG